MLYSGSAPTYTLKDSKRFIQSMFKEARQHRALHHPFLMGLARGGSANQEVVLKDFLFQYLAYSNDFLRYLTATIAQLEEREHREMLVHNLMEEAGKVDPDDEPALREAGIEIEWIAGIPHPKLYHRFLDSVGMGQDFRSKNGFCDEALVWRRMFFTICSSGGAAQALGAMGLGTENIVKFVYAQILEAISRTLDVSPRDRVFFDLHATVDDEHGEVIDNIAAEFAMYRRNREPLRNGMLMALGARAAFFDGMQARSLVISSVGEDLSDDRGRRGESRGRRRAA